MRPYRQCTAPLVRWTPSLNKLRALSIRQPWAWLKSVMDNEPTVRHDFVHGPFVRQERNVQYHPRAHLGRQAHYPRGAGWQGQAMGSNIDI